MRPSRVRYAEYTQSKTKIGDAADPTGPRRSRGFPSLIREIFRLLGSRGWILAASLGTLTVATTIGLLVPGTTKIAVDYVILDSPGPHALPGWVPFRDNRHALLWVVGGVMFSTAALAVLIGMWGRYQSTRLTKLLQSLLRRKAFRHAVTLPLPRVYSLKSGGVASLLREDAGAAGDLIFSLIYNPWRAIIQFVGTLVVLAFTDWRMLVGGLVLVPATWFTHRQWINKIRPLYRDIKNTRTATDAAATEVFAGIRIVRGFSRGKTEGLRFTIGNHLMARQEMLTWWRSRVLEVVWGFLIPGASVGVLLYGGSRVLAGDLTIGDVMMFTTYVLFLLGPLEVLTSTATMVQTNLAALDRVLDLLEEPPEFADTKPTTFVSRATSQGLVEFQGVWFAYPPTKGKSPPQEAHWVLREINLTIPPGKTVALVGASGSGKTTLSNLLARFYDPSKGRVLFDGTPLREIEPAGYRSLLGIVEQDVFLFDGSIAENISYGRRDAAPDQIEAAARAAHAHEFIVATEKGYQTLIGERGVRLSGGQRQRLALARAILANPLILILDEATSNLDAQSEAAIQETMSTLLKGRTCLVIAHRLSTVRHADEIVVLDRGEIIERGTHEELLTRHGAYERLVRTQLEPA